MGVFAFRRRRVNTSNGIRDALGRFPWIQMGQELVSEASLDYFGFVVACQKMGPFMRLVWSERRHDRL